MQIIGGLEGSMGQFSYKQSSLAWGLIITIAILTKGLNLLSQVLLKQIIYQNVAPWFSSLQKWRQNEDSNINYT